MPFHQGRKYLIDSLADRLNPVDAQLQHEVLLVLLEDHVVDVVGEGGQIQSRVSVAR